MLKLLPIALVLVVTAVMPASAQSPSDEVEALLALPHGLERLSPDERKRLEGLRANPGPAVQALTDLYQGKDLIALAGEPALRLERAMALLGALGGAEARTLLSKWFVVVDDKLDASPRARALRSYTLVALGDQPDPVVTTRVLARLANADPALRAGDLMYLARSGRGDPNAIAALEARLAEPALAADPAARRALILMRSGLPATTPPSGPEAVIERLLELPLDAVDPLPADKTLIAQVVASPTPYLPILSARLSDTKEIGVEPGRTRFLSGLWLLGRLPADASAPVLAATFLRIDDSLFDRAAPHKKVIWDLRRATLAALAGRCPPSVAERVITRLPESPPDWRPAALDWLRRGCAGDSAMTGRLRQLGKSGPLANDPSVRDTLRAMERRP